MSFNIQSLSDTWVATRFFYQRYPARLVAVVLVSIAIGLSEMVSTALMLPILAVGTGAGLDNDLAEITTVMMEFVGLQVDFYNLFAVFVLFFSLNIVFILVAGIFVDNCLVLIKKDLRNQIIDGLREVSMDYFASQSHGKIANALLQEIDRAAGIFSQIKMLAINAIMLGVFGTLGVTVSWELLTGAVFFALVGIFLAQPMFRMARIAGAGHVMSLRTMSSDLLQGIGNYKAYKAMGREKQLMRALTEANDSFQAANYLNVKAKHYLQAIQRGLFLGAMVLAVYGAREFLNIDMLELGFIALLLMRINNNLTELLKKFQTITNNIFALDKFNEFLADLIGHREQLLGQTSPHLPAPIRFEGVSVTHGAVKALDNVSLEIPSVGLTAIIGPSGSGKTTVTDIICGFRSPDSGSIRIGELSFVDLDIKDLRSRLGYVSQETNLLNRSIRENVAAFDANIKEEAILGALLQAGLAKKLQNLEDGIHSNVGESGSRLSGGERQRVALARALARGAQVLILDEPTSALDRGTADRIMETVKTLSADHCIIVVSHDPGFAEIADKVIHLDHGRIVPCHQQSVDED